MTKTAKVLLGIGGVLVILVAVIGVVGYFALNYIEARLEAGSKPDQEAGIAFARGTDQKGCQDEALRRAKTIGFLNVDQGMSLSSFTEACFKTAKPTPEFCAGAPGFWSLEKSDWIHAECRKAGLDNQKTGCFYVFQAKHTYCSPPK